MKLHNDPFNLIKSGTKTIELRLNDLKRQKIKVGDLIEFTNRVTDEKIVVRVVDLIKFNSFSDLYKNFSKVSMGYREDEEANPSDMELYYSLEDQEKYGVLAIKIEKIVK
jgi:ASC-1-like (ASCH) protein